jgi:hypothetical protein
MKRSKLFGTLAGAAALLSAFAATALALEDNEPATGFFDYNPEDYDEPMEILGLIWELILSYIEQIKEFFSNLFSA